MEIIVSEIGETAIAVLIFIAIVGILGKVSYTTSDGRTVTGYNNVIAANMDSADYTYDNYTDDTAVIEAANVIKPEIKYNETQEIIKAGEAVALDDYFIAVLDGVEYAASDIDTFSIVKIMNGATDITAIYNQQNRTAVFPEDAVYEITAYVYDAVNNEVTVTINVPVEKRV